MATVFQFISFTSLYRCTMNEPGGMVMEIAYNNVFRDHTSDFCTRIFNEYRRRVGARVGEGGGNA